MNLSKFKKRDLKRRIKELERKIDVMNADRANEYMIRRELEDQIERLAVENASLHMRYFMAKRDLEAAEATINGLEADVAMLDLKYAKAKRVIRDHDIDYA